MSSEPRSGPGPDSASAPAPAPSTGTTPATSGDTPPTRRRPAYRKGRATLTREGVGRAALGFLGRRGPAELTMRSLAADLGVSPRALYNYVEDRRDLITVAAEIFEADWQPPELDASDARWRTTLHAYCADLRAHYRRHPGMTTLALRENVTMARHPAMLRNVDALIGFFVARGLPLRTAYVACMETLRMVVAFVEFQDALSDRPPEHLDPEDGARLPPSWLPPGEDLPHLTRLTQLGLSAPTSDELFEFAVRTLADGLAARAEAESDGEAEAGGAG